MNIIESLNTKIERKMLYEVKCSQINQTIEKSNQDSELSYYYVNCNNKESLLTCWREHSLHTRIYNVVVVPNE